MTAERTIAGIERRCAAGLDLVTLRSDVLGPLRTVLSVDSAFLATVDPATLLFTSALAEEPLLQATTMFLDNEFGSPDVNKFAALARSPEPVRSLDQATNAHRGASARYVEVLAPLGLGDELRAALTVGGRCWGVICLHRQESVFGFNEAEMKIVRRLAPHLAAGLRRTVLTNLASAGNDAGGPGLLVLDEDLSVVSVNEAAERWLSESALGDQPQFRGLPLPVYAAARLLDAGSDEDDWTDGSRVHDGPGMRPRPRMQTRSGQWLTVHATRLHGTGGRGATTAIILEPAAPQELGSFVLSAAGLTPAQERVATLVLQGLSTRQIMRDLQISSNTLQEHLRQVFDKFGIGSRRELVAAILTRR